MHLLQNTGYIDCYLLAKFPEVKLTWMTKKGSIPFLYSLIFFSPPLLFSTLSVYRPCGLDFINGHKSNLVLTKCSSESMRAVLSRLWLELCAQKN